MWRLIFIAIAVYLAYSVLRSCEAPSDYQVKQELRQAGDAVEDSTPGRAVKESVKSVEELIP